MESPESPPAAAAGSGGANERARGPAQPASERPAPLPEAAAAFSFAVVDARAGCGRVGAVLGAAPAPGLGPTAPAAASRLLPPLGFQDGRSGGGVAGRRFRFRCAVCEGKRFSRQLGEGLYCPSPSVPGVSVSSVSWRRSLDRILAGWHPRNNKWLQESPQCSRPPNLGPVRDGDP